MNYKKIYLPNVDSEFVVEKDFEYNLIYITNKRNQKTPQKLCPLDRNICKGVLQRNTKQIQYILNTHSESLFLREHIQV